MVVLITVAVHLICGYFKPCYSLKEMTFCQHYLAFGLRFSYSTSLYNLISYVLPIFSCMIPTVLIQMQIISALKLVCDFFLVFIYCITINHSIHPSQLTPKTFHLLLLKQ